MVPTYLNLPRTIKHFSAKFRICSKRRNLITRLSDSVLELIGEEEKIGIDRIEREARKYKGLAKKADIISNIQNVIVNHCNLVQEPSITGKIFNVDFKRDYDDEKLGYVYTFFPANKRSNKELPLDPEKRERRIRSISKEVLELLKKEEKGKIGRRYITHEAKKYLNASKHEGCVKYIRSSLLRHLKKVQAPAITAEVFGIDYKINRDNTKMTKLYDFYVQTA